jgi:SAM-dependent methyltransferase
VTVDPRAASGFAAAVDDYERGRPAYPAAAVRTVARELGLTPASTVLDLAAGTGKLTRRLVPLAGRVIAVEPSEPMLDRLRAKLPEVDARAGTAESIPVADHSVDALFVGEAFHWFRTAEACREIGRVLVPGGGLVLLWNRAQWSETELPWLSEFDALVRPYRRAAGEFPAGNDGWRLAVDESNLFGAVSCLEADYVHRISAEGFVALVGSFSWIANLPDEKRGGVLRRVRALAGAQPEVTLRYRTQIYWTLRR